MKIIDNAVLKENYDVIIIGSGIGGITAASLLAKKGADVLLIEQHFMPGGCCSAVRRGGVTSDVGASMLFGFGEKGLTAHRFVHNALEEPIDVIPTESVYKMHWNKEGKHKSVTLWRDFEKYFKELTTAFPGTDEQLRKFYNHIFGMYESLTKVEMPMAFTELPISLAMKMFFKAPIGLLKVLPAFRKTGRDIIDKFFSDPDLISFFDMMILCMNTVKSDVNPALLSSNVFSLMAKDGAYYPVGSPQTVPNTMERAFERYGGTTLYRRKVKEILFDPKNMKKPKAIGVMLDDGTKIYAKGIVSNSNIYNFFGGLIPPAYCKPGKVEETMNLQASSAVFPVYLSVDEAAIPKGTRPVELFVDDISDLTNMKAVMVFTPSLEDSTLCPDEGVHSMTVIKQADGKKWPRPEDPLYQSDDYNAMKERVADELLASMEKHFPNLRKHVKTMAISTPSTLERFTLKRWGNIGGPVQKKGQDLFKRVHAKVKNYKNLYMCGDSTVMGTGVVSSCMSGVSVANCIIKDQKLGKIYKPKKFEKQYVNHVGEHEKKLSPLISHGKLIETREEAKRCARECNWCADNFCMAKCPASIDVNNFIRRIEVNNFNGAARYLYEMNPLSSICGDICPSEKFCESSCYKLDYKDVPVRIKDLQKWVCKETESEELNISRGNIIDKKIAIVGAGPAGLSCAHYLARLGYYIDILEKSNKVGGMLSHVIPEKRLPKESLERDLKRLSLPSINYKHGMELGKNVLLENLSKEYDAVFIAPGLWKGRTLPLQGIENANVMDALSFIQSYNNTGKVDVKGKLLVIGGGSVAADAVLVAREGGIKNITMVCLESRDEMPALKHEIDEILECGCSLENSWGPKEISGGKMTFMECTSVFDSEGNFSPKFNDKNLKEFEFDQTIMAVGQTMENSLGKYLEQELGKGLINVDPETQLVRGKNNIYAGGDIVRGAGTVVQSVADGRNAARAIHQDLTE